MDAPKRLPAQPAPVFQPEESVVDRDMRLMQYAGADRVIHRHDPARLANIAARRKQIKNFRTGIPGLDALVDGIQTGELIAVGGPRKNGKTLLAQTLTSHLSRAGCDVLWFSYEVPDIQFEDQMGPDVAFYVPGDLVASDLSWFEERIIEGKLKFDTRVVFVDHLHYLVDLVTARNISLDLGRIIRGLKRMAIKHNLIMFILCHSKKPEIDPKTKEIKEVSDWDMRDSSFIPQESDTTWMVQRTEDDKTMVKVCCHRRTGVLGKKLWMFKGERFLEEYHDETTSVGESMGRATDTDRVALDNDRQLFPDPD